MYGTSRQKGIDIYLKTLSWALLNFELQSLLSRPGQGISGEIEKKLYAIGYMQEYPESPNTLEMEKLFNEGEFFSCTKTGNRIVAFALRENGLNKENFVHIEKSITDAYLQIRQSGGENSLLDKSYAYTIEALTVFRL